MGTKHRVGSRIQALRKHRGLTQPQLAELIGRSVDAVSNLERGISAPNFETLERLSDKLNVPVKDFFDFKNDPDDPRRVANISKLLDFARQLDDAHLDIAVDQIGALAAKSKGGRI